MSFGSTSTQLVAARHEFHKTECFINTSTSSTGLGLGLGLVLLVLVLVLVLVVL